MGGADHHRDKSTGRIGIGGRQIGGDPVAKKCQIARELILESPRSHWGRCIRRLTENGAEKMPEADPVHADTTGGIQQGRIPKSLVGVVEGSRAITNDPIAISSQQCGPSQNQSAPDIISTIHQNPGAKRQSTDQLPGRHRLDIAGHDPCWQFGRAIEPQQVLTPSHQGPVASLGLHCEGPQHQADKQPNPPI